MPTADGDRPGRTALAELREFLAFLRSLWGILAGVTVVFPISNLLTAVLPLLPGSERLSTVLATLFSLFAIFVVFALRHVDLNDEYGGEDSGLFIVASIWIFVGGAGVLIAYLYVRLEPLATGLVPVLYATVFGLFAAAFTLLALVEYVHDSARGEGAKQTSKEISDLLDDLKQPRGR
jgi:hypothetical protein